MCRPTLRSLWSVYHCQYGTQNGTVDPNQMTKHSVRSILFAVPPPDVRLAMVVGRSTGTRQSVTRVLCTISTNIVVLVGFFLLVLVFSLMYSVESLFLSHPRFTAHTTYSHNQGPSHRFLWFCFFIVCVGVWVDLFCLLHSIPFHSIIKQWTPDPTTTTHTTHF